MINKVDRYLTDRLSPEMHEIISKHDVISFDIFDTLLIRKLLNPEDVFTLMERETGVIGFRSLRVKAEAIARERLYKEIKKSEVNLEEIYRELDLPSSVAMIWSPQRLMKSELDLERRLLIRSPSVEPIYRTAKALGKRVIAVSDMYLPSEFIQEVLLANDIVVDKIFVSCAYRAAKYEGKLYERVSADLKVKPSQILHFGDNFKSDCEAALKAGVIGYYLPSLRDKLFRDTRFNQTAISRLVSSGNLFSSILVAYLSIFKEKNPSLGGADLFGAMYAGPLVSGFAYWLSIMAKIDGIEYVRLATRDGYITADIWKHLGLHTKSSVFFTSRRLTLLPALLTNFDEELPSLLSSSTTVSLKDCIHRLGLSGESELLERLSKITEVDRPITSLADSKSALKALKMCKSLLQSEARKELNGYMNYLKKIGFNTKKDAFADCGWAISSQRRMEKFMDLKFTGYYVGSLAHAYTHEKINSFLFHNGDDKHWLKITDDSIELLELPFSSLEKQVCRFDALDSGDANPVFTDEDPQYSEVREVFIKCMQTNMISFANFLSPFLNALTVDFFRESLLILFDSLVSHPTPFEYHELAILPHDRELGKSGFATIGTFWRVNRDDGYITHSMTKRWNDYVRLGWISLRQYGVGVTLLRTLRVIRRHL